MVQLVDLPSEVLAQVARFCEGSLKDLRLTNSRVSQASTPAFFRSITIVPHAASFADLLAISRSPLARHVHDITYDVRMLSRVSDVQMAFESNEFSLVGTDVSASRRKIFALLDDYEKQAFRSVDMVDVELKHLLAVLPNLPNLEHITITAGNLCELPYFYRKLKKSLSITSDYYFETSNHSGHHARSVLLCLGALDLKTPRLSFVGVDWSEIVLFGELCTPERYLTILQRVFRTLPREGLPLSMFLFLYTSKGDGPGMAIEDLMPACASVLDNVQHLTLSLATARSERQLFMPTGPSWPLSAGTRCAWLHWVVECMRSIGQVGPKGVRSLTLSSLVLDQECLKFFLDGCGDSLTDLTVGDVRLYTTSNNPAFDAVVEESCWVSVLDMIPRYVRHLKNVRLFGRFYNGGSQDWVLSARSKGTLRTDVEHWLTEGGICPLDSERLAGGLQGTRAGDPSFKIFRRTLEDGADDEVDYDFPPTSENEILSTCEWDASEDQDSSPEGPLVEPECLQNLVQMRHGFIVWATEGLRFAMIGSAIIAWSMLGAAATGKPWVRDRLSPDE